MDEEGPGIVKGGREGKCDQGSNIDRQETLEPFQGLTKREGYCVRMQTFVSLACFLFTALED